MKCVECGKEQLHPVCADCAFKVMDRAEERGLVVVGRSESRRLAGFRPPSAQGERDP